MREALGWIGLAVALTGVVVYVLVLLRRPHLVRILNGSGLLFSSLALSQAPIVLSHADGSDLFELEAMMILLIAAVVAQITAALRNRKAWDGVERRSGLLEGRV
jgi:hypothetical protein